MAIDWSAPDIRHEFKFELVDPVSFSKSYGYCGDVVSCEINEDSGSDLKASASIEIYGERIDLDRAIRIHHTAISGSDRYEEVLGTFMIDEHDWTCKKGVFHGTLSLQSALLKLRGYIITGGKDADLLYSESQPEVYSVSSFLEKAIPRTYAGNPVFRNSYPGNSVNSRDLKVVCGDSMLEVVNRLVDLGFSGGGGVEPDPMGRICLTTKKDSRSQVISLNQFEVVDEVSVSFPSTYTNYYFFSGGDSPSVIEEFNTGEWEPRPDTIGRFSSACSFGLGESLSYVEKSIEAQKFIAPNQHSGTYTIAYRPLSLGNRIRMGDPIPQYSGYREGIVTRRDLELTSSLPTKITVSWDMSLIRPDI